MPEPLEQFAPGSLCHSNLFLGEGSDKVQLTTMLMGKRKNEDQCPLPGGYRGLLKALEFQSPSEKTGHADS